MLARLGDRWLEPRIYDKLARWFWSGILGEFYGGAVDTRMANDYEELLRTDAFQDFLEDRRRRLCQLIGAAMVKAVAQTAAGGRYEERGD